MKTMTINFSWRPDGSYEWRNASTGCTRAARLAGTYAAIIATMIIAAARGNRYGESTIKVDNEGDPKSLNPEGERNAQ